MESSRPNSVVVNRVYRDCPIRIREYKFSRDMIEFDVILGMDILLNYQFNI